MKKLFIIMILFSGMSTIHTMESDGEESYEIDFQKQIIELKALVDKGKPRAQKFFDSLNPITVSLLKKEISLSILERSITERLSTFDDHPSARKQGSEKLYRLFHAPTVQESGFFFSPVSDKEVASAVSIVLPFLRKLRAIEFALPPTCAQPQVFAQWIIDNHSKLVSANPQHIDYDLCYVQQFLEDLDEHEKIIFATLSHLSNRKATCEQNHDHSNNEMIVNSDSE